MHCCLGYVSLSLVYLWCLFFIHGFWFCLVGFSGLRLWWKMLHAGFGACLNLGFYVVVLMVEAVRVIMHLAVVYCCSWNVYSHKCALLLSWLSLLLKLVDCAFFVVWGGFGILTVFILLIVCVILFANCFYLLNYSLSVLIILQFWLPFAFYCEIWETLEYNILSLSLSIPETKM